MADLTGLVSQVSNVAAQAQQSFGTPSAFTIEELTGKQRVLLLAGRALPYRPYEVSGDMRAEFTWYPGNPIGTVQVLGAQEGTTTIRGMWKDRYIGAGPVDLVGAITSGIQSQIGSGPPGGAQPDAVATVDGAQVPDVATLAATVDDIRRQGQLLEVHWDTLVRQGIMTKFVQQWDRHEDLTYEITFQWISQGEPESPVILSNEPDRAALLANLQTALATLQMAISAPFQITEAFSDATGEAMNTMNSAVVDLGSTQSNYSTGSISSVSSSQRTLAAINTIQAAADAILAACEAQPPRAIVNAGLNSQGQPDVNSITYGVCLEAAEYIRQLLLAANAMAVLCADQGQQLAARVVDDEVIAVFTARQNMDLRNVSTQYYGTQDEWTRIAQYNGLVQSGLVAGQVIFVPQLRPTDQSGGSP